MAERDQPALARRIQQLAESGDYEGFNAILGSLNDELDATTIEVIRSDPEFKHRITDMCRDAWERKHAAPPLN